MPDDEKQDERKTTSEPEEKPDPPKQPRKTVPVNVIETKDGSVLVEWFDKDDARRCFLPEDEISGEKASKEALEAGIPYGVPWEKHLPGLPQSMANTLGAELRRRGVWRGEDLQDANAVKRAIGATVGNIYTLLKQAAQEVENAKQDE
jgi:hypothetical protein